MQSSHHWLMSTGTSCLYMFLLGQQSFQLSTFLYPPEPSGEDEHLPELDVSISVPIPLIPVEDFTERWSFLCNRIVEHHWSVHDHGYYRLTIHMYPVPMRWHTSIGGTRDWRGLWGQMGGTTILGLLLRLVPKIKVQKCYIQCVHCWNITAWLQSKHGHLLDNCYGLNMASILYTSVRFALLI